MSYFDHASNVAIRSLVVQHTAVEGHANSALDRLEGCIAAGASHDSAERTNAPMCHPETRIAVQDDIHRWINSSEEERDRTSIQSAQFQRTYPIMWLTGPAGAGKTAIAGSVAERCKETGALAGSFFFSSFSGSRDRRSKRCFVATLAYQLTLGVQEHNQGLRGRILSAIERNPSVLKSRLKNQLEELILSPLREEVLHRESQGSLPSIPPSVIVIDGLDECQADPSSPGAGYPPQPSRSIRRQNEEDQTEILSLLEQAARDPHFPFRILVASRPEPAIKRFFEDLLSDIAHTVFLGEGYDPDSDIRRFIQTEFADIRRRYELPASWPTKEQIDTIIYRASGQFIYAATIIRFVGDGTHHPQTQLDTALPLHSGRKDSEGRVSFDALDDLYTHILKTSPDPTLAASWIVVSTSFDSTIGASLGLPAMFWKQFMETKPGMAAHLLENLASLLFVPPPDDEVSVYQIYHRTLLDFLYGRARCSGVFPDCGPSDKDTPEFSHEFYFQLFEDAWHRTILINAPTIISDRQPVCHTLDDEALNGFLSRFQSLNPWPLSSLEENTPGLDWASSDIPLFWVDQALSGGIIKTNATTQVLLRLWFVHAHHNCRWFRCTPLCKRWREAIITRCRKRGWSTPGKADLFWERFRKIEQGRKVTTSAAYFNPT